MRYTIYVREAGDDEAISRPYDETNRKARAIERADDAMQCPDYISAWVIDWRSGTPVYRCYQEPANV